MTDFSPHILLMSIPPMNWHVRDGTSGTSSGFCRTYGALTPARLAAWRICSCLLRLRGFNRVLRSWGTSLSLTTSEKRFADPR